jgi:hypothetical protein
MEMTNGAHGSSDKLWLRCSRCHHMSLMETGESAQGSGKGKLDPAAATKYSPQASFKVGEAVFHSEWNDVGKVVSKTKTTDGYEAIVVSFEKGGQRKLLSNVKPEESEIQQGVHEIQS